MEKKSFSPKANRVLYTVIVAALCIVAVIIGIVAAVNRPPDTGSIPSGSGSTTTNTPNNPSQPTGGEDAETVFLCPLSGHVSKQHDTETLVFSQTMGDWRVHTGIDIAAQLGDPVCAAADGVVKEVWEDALMGTCVSVSHDDDIVSIYKNLSPELAEGIKAGATLQAGDTIGAVGESALCEIADEPHLHFEMTEAGVAVDPLAFLSEDSQQASLTFDSEIIED